MGVLHSVGILFLKQAAIMTRQTLSLATVDPAAARLPHVQDLGGQVRSTEKLDGKPACGPGGVQCSQPNKQAKRAGGL